MKFLFAANFLKERHSGAPGHIMQLVSALREKGHSAHCLFRDDMMPGIRRNVLLHALVFLLFTVLISFKIFYLNFTNRYDLIIIASGDGFLYAILSRLIPRKNRPLIIMRTHGHEYLYRKEYDKERILRRDLHFSLREKAFLSGFRILQVKIFSYFCDGIFVLNEEERRYIQGLYPAKNVFAVGIGIDPLFLSSIQMVRERDILFVGGWCHMKGQSYLVEILSALAREREDLSVSLVGTGVSDERVLKDFPARLTNNIRVFKFLPREELKKEYATHKIFLLPSLFEGYGNAILEAMASGMVVVISKGLGASEKIQDGHNGFLVEKRDVHGFVRVIKEIITDEGRMSAIGENARDTVKEMTWERAADKFSKDCRILMENRVER